MRLFNNILSYLYSICYKKSENKYVLQAQNKLFKASFEIFIFHFTNFHPIKTHFRGFVCLYYRTYLVSRLANFAKFSPIKKTNEIRVCPCRHGKDFPRAVPGTNFEIRTEILNYLIIKNTFKIALNEQKIGKKVNFSHLTV